MNTLAILTEAIKQRKSISFKYNLEGRAIGLRYGNSHAIYFSSAGHINIHIWKTDGVKTDLAQILPTWRTYRIEYIEDITIFDEQKSFEIATGYKSGSEMYKKAIVKL